MWPVEPDVEDRTATRTRGRPAPRLTKDAALWRSSRAGASSMPPRAPQLKGDTHVHGRPGQEPVKPGIVTPQEHDSPLGSRDAWQLPTTAAESDRSFQAADLDRE
jgi:hypothetical protein